MKKLLLSVAILVGATLLLSLDTSKEVETLSQQQIAKADLKTNVDS
ncbi:MAG: hypothetical protein HKP45_02195 [Winogradskyella sp.]|nr:hypothetical protein [Winogradskyella sp.]MBT8377282.1 hypothetical protein [Bacteroidia bacterium]NNK39445.1 hypothetical protein [Winogradskyella sp.]NNL83480.1 hypothetical protein [Winogradskyella sp.]